VIWAILHYGMMGWCLVASGVVLKLGGSVYRWFGPSYTIPDFKNEASRFKWGGI